MAILNKLRAAIYDHKWLRVLLFPVLKARNFRGSRRLAAQYRVLDLLSVCLVEDPVIRVPEFPGKYAIGPQSDIFKRITIYGEYEPDIARICREFIDRNRDAIDVGANIGLFTVLFAQSAPARKVLAIEPTKGASRRLRKNIEMNGISDRVHVFEGIASDHVGDTQITVVLGREEYSTAGARQFWALEPAAQARARKEPVAASTIDGLVERFGMNPGFIKIDVEGMEHTVVRGMAETLRKHRPVVLMEASDPLLRSNGCSLRELIGMMESAGYTTRPMTGEVLCVPINSSRALAAPTV